MMRGRVVVLATAALGACGCAATSGSAWVCEAEPGPFSAAQPDGSIGEPPIEASAEPRSALLADESEPAPRARTRLARTLTLGEVHATYPERAPLSSAVERAPVNVTINNYVTTTPSGYYGTPLVTYPSAGHGSRPRPAPRTAPTQPGQDWPAVPNPGPAFPFKTAPASPWR